MAREIWGVEWVAATVTTPLLTRRLLLQFVADPGAVTAARVEMFHAPLILRGATEAFGDCWLSVTSRDVRKSAQADAYRALALPTLIVWGDLDTTAPRARGPS
jgi:pimeloyl-ACP methyl ester carboxylesterase